MEAAKSKGLEAVFLRLSGLSSEVGHLRSFYYGRRSLSRIDGAIVRSLGSVVSVEQYVRRIALLKEMERSGITVMNPVEGLVMARDKYGALALLSRHGIKVPRTLVTEDLGLAYNFSKEVGRVVVKPLIGSRGYGSVLIEDPEVALRVFKTLISFNQVIYVQEYVAKRHFDLRVFVLGGEVLACIKRVSVVPGEWRTNIAQGGKAEAYKAPPEVEEMAIKACEVLGLWYAGVDVIERGGEYLILEVNAAPDWHGLMEATGVKPAKAIIDFIVEKVKK